MSHESTASIQPKITVKEMTASQRKNLQNNQKLIILILLAVFSILIYQFINVDTNYFSYVMGLRTPKMLGMVIGAFCIGVASIIFQTIINNTIVTPCLLGMNALYILIHTILIFFLGSSHVLITNKNIAFLLDIVLMGFMATLIYSYLFKKTKYNILYVLLTGTIMATLFGSISSTLTRVMDPNEFANLQASLLASFSNINKDIILLSVVLIGVIMGAFYKKLELLDVITLGKHQAINLGIDYDKTITQLLLVVTLLITIATAMIGPISFLGLIIANISRQLFRTYRHTYLMAGSALVGVIILVAGQCLIEHVFTYSTTISVFINIFGGIYFMYLLLKNKGA